MILVVVFCLLNGVIGFLPRKPKISKPIDKAIFGLANIYRRS